MLSVVILIVVMLSVMAPNHSLLVYLEAQGVVHLDLSHPGVSVTHLEDAGVLVEALL